MSEPKLLQLSETIEQETTRRAMGIIAASVRSCNNAVTQLKVLAADRGGKAAFLLELGDKAQPLQDACLDLKALVEKLSDLTGETLE